jgi:hypothetical protein
MSFYVMGGVYTTTGMMFLEEGKAERYGPFETREEALKVWSGKARANIDNCLHCLKIVEEE